MKSKNVVVGTAVASLLALGTLSAAQAAEKSAEKCYGVVKAGKNDCQTNTSACAGTATKDSQKDAWIYLPKGTCEKIVGASTKKG
jgi:uncharacterized membrane protein